MQAIFGFGVALRKLRRFWAILGHFFGISWTYCGVRGHQRALQHKETKLVAVYAMAILNQFWGC